MPIRYRRDPNKGPYFQYGKKGKKYYYIVRDKASRIKAYNLCLKQARAIIASQKKKYYSNRISNK